MTAEKTVIKKQANSTFPLIIREIPKSGLGCPPLKQVGGVSLSSTVGDLTQLLCFTYYQQAWALSFLG